MALVEKPLKNNSNKCFICNLSNDEEYWDTGHSFDAPIVLPEEGRKYVCKSCIYHAAKEFGFLKPEEVQKLEERAEYLEVQNEQLHKQADIVAVVKELYNSLAVDYPHQFGEEAKQHGAKRVAKGKNESARS